MFIDTESGINPTNYLCTCLPVFLERVPMSCLPKHVRSQEIKVKGKKYLHNRPAHSPTLHRRDREYVRETVVTRP